MTSDEHIEVHVRVEPSRFAEVAQLAPFEPIDMVVMIGSEATVADAVAAATARVDPEVLRGPFGLALSFAGSERGEGEHVVGEVMLLDADGRLRITSDPAQMRYDDLLRAQAFGLVQGDPQRLVLRPEPPRALVGGAMWDAFVDALDVGLDVAEKVVIATEFVKLLRRVAARLRPAAPVLRRHGDELEEAGIRPTVVRDVLLVRAWTTSEIAAALRLSDDEARTLLWSLGMDEDRHGQWWLSDDDVVVAAIEHVLTIARGYEAATRDRDGLVEKYREYFEERLGRPGEPRSEH
jgi:hypothetical protein